MEQARQRVIQRDAAGVGALLQLVFFILFLGIVLALAAGGHHGGFHYLQSVTQALLPDPVWAAVTRFGDGRILLVLSLLFVRRRPEIFWAMIVAAVIGGLYSRGMKIHFDALRPPAVLPLADIHLVGPKLTRHSFPSGHALSAFLFAGVLFAFSDSRPQRVMLILAATLVGLSRVAVGVHWPQDVVAGAFSGLMIAAAGVWITRYWQAGLAPVVHLGMLVVPVLAMFMLLEGDGGNPATPVLVYTVILVASAKMLHDYRDIFRFS